MYIHTEGIKGCIELDLKDEQVSNSVLQLHSDYNYYAPGSIDFGITINKAEAPFNNTVIVNLLPRYVLVNKLDHPIVIK
jgi:hypothetical protein